MQTAAAMAPTERPQKAVAPVSRTEGGKAALREPERRCPVSGQLASAGVCPMAKPARGSKALPKDQDVEAGRQKADAFETLVLYGQQELEHHAYVQALKAFTKAAELEPGHEEVYRGKVVALRRLNRPRGALKACYAALSALPECQPLMALRDELVEELGSEAEEISAEGTSLARGGSEEASEQTTDCASGASDEEVEEEPEEEQACPASKSRAQVEQERQALRAQLTENEALGGDSAALRTEASAAYREARKKLCLEFYRDFYQRTRARSKQTVDTSQYTKAEKNGLSIKGGHRHMPRPEHVDLPADHKQPVGTLSPAELAKYGADNGRMLLSVHGDLFDVSDRPDKYGSEGPYYTMPGHDITWALWSGYDEEEEWDKYFDLHQAKPKEERDKRFQGLMSWWAFFEQEYGAPVGRLDVYDREWELPAPPAVKDLCAVM